MKNGDFANVRFPKGTVEIAVASCCDEPDWAWDLLTKFKTSGGSSTMRAAMHYGQIHYGRKTQHLKEIANASKVPYNEMFFFDDQSGHIRDVGGLGVTAVQTPNNGVTWDKFIEALKRFQKQ